MDSDGEGDDSAQVMLGFAEVPEQPHDLLRHRFPSKLGGRPAWLDPVNLPTRQQLTCSTSGEPLQFLLQVYCPRDTNPDQGFHRTLFLFISSRGDQLTAPGAVRALRCQLPRANPFYDFHPAPPQQQLPQPLQGDQLAAATARDPWQVAASESGAVAAAAPPGAPALLLPEQELVVEPEPEEGEGDMEPEVARVMADYQARVAVEGEYDEQELPPSMLDELEASQGPDKAAFAAFQARTARAPEQVLRYCSQAGAAPLWLSTQHVPGPGDVPPCPHCGAARAFEFQVMPQLLTFLDLDASDPHAPDWGTIAVYTCPASCNVAPQQDQQGACTYVEEFVWVQPS